MKKLNNPRQASLKENQRFSVSLGEAVSLAESVSLAKRIY